MGFGMGCGDLGGCEVLEIWAGDIGRGWGLGELMAGRFWSPGGKEVGLRRGRFGV